MSVRRALGPRRLVDAAAILAHYAGTTSGPRPEGAVRSCPPVVQARATKLRLYGRGDRDDRRIAGSFSADAQLGHEDHRLRLVSAGPAPSSTIRPRQAGSGPGEGRRPHPGVLEAARTTAIAAIRPRSTKSGIDAINETQLDLYLRGVVPAEMPASWPIEALRAQAIAARSYAGHRIHARTGQWDLTTTRGLAIAFAGRRRRPRRSRRRPGSWSGAGPRQRPPPDGGGATEDNENVFTSDRHDGGPVISGLSRPRTFDGSTFDDAPRETWLTAGYSYAQLSAVRADARTNVGR
jgi:hypothetical protein